MTEDSSIITFLSHYEEPVFSYALKVRGLLLSTLPDIVEQLDIPARLIGYGYGQKYAELICVIIPSKKGLKLGFNRGVDLPDPDKLLGGTGKISRYVVINSEEQISSTSLKILLENALEAYRLRMTITK